MSRIRLTLPNLISFTTLGAAVMSIACSIHGNYSLAGALILVGYVLDGLDGEVARRIQGLSEFGIQLDSLVDLVHFGVATSVLLGQYLHSGPLSIWPLWALLAVYVIAGAYRLARFNLTAMQQNKDDTTGLTISTGGAYLTLAVLGDLAFQGRLFGDWFFPPLILLTSLLMVSRIRFPELQAVLKHRWLSAAALTSGVAFSIWLNLPLVWWTYTTLYLSFGLARAIRSLL